MLRASFLVISLASTPGLPNHMDIKAMHACQWIDILFGYWTEYQCSAGVHFNLHLEDG